MRAARLMGLLSVALAMMAPGMAFAKKYALLIGVNKYSVDDDLVELSFAERDVYQLEKTLESIGYEYIEVMTTKEVGLKLATAQNINDAIKRFCNRDFTANDHLLIAFSGHGVGVQVKGMPNKYQPCFCATDTNLKNPGNPRLIFLEQVREQMTKTKAGVKLLFSDACRNERQIGKGAKAAGRDGQFNAKGGANGKPFKGARAKSGYAEYFSCNPGQRSYESDTLQHSYFFYYLIKGFKGDADNAPKDGHLTAYELSDYLSKGVFDRAWKDKKILQKPGALIRRTEPLELAQFPDRVVTWLPVQWNNKPHLKWEAVHWRPQTGERVKERRLVVMARQGAPRRLYAGLLLTIAGKDADGKAKTFEMPFRLMTAKPPFYMTENMVHAELFLHFARLHPNEFSPDSVWRQALQRGLPPKQRQLPAFHVSFAQAERFGEWLFAALPKAAEWDYSSAADKAKKRGLQGPFLPQLPGRKAQIAIWGKPLPIGSAAHDVSDRLIRDMAGNGLEWTSDRLGRYVVLRSRPWHQKQPYRYTDPEDDPKVAPITGSRYIGFRLVVRTQ